MARHPLISIHIHEFIEDLQEMGDKIKWNSITSFDKKFQTEQCSLKDFINHFKEKATWSPVLSDKGSIFLKLLFLDNLFIVNNKKANIMKDGKMNFDFFEDA